MLAAPAVRQALGGRPTDHLTSRLLCLQTDTGCVTISAAVAVCIEAGRQITRSVVYCSEARKASTLRAPGRDIE